MTEAEAVSLIYANERAALIPCADHIRRDVATGQSVGYYYDTFHYIPRGVLPPDREWAVFVAACAAAIAEILGYAVDLHQHGVEGNGHGAWDVVPMESP